MYLVCSKIFPIFPIFCGRCCGPDKLLVTGPWTTLEASVQNVAETVTHSILNSSGYSFTVLSILSNELCTMNLILP